jgi:Fe-S oxidoreductase
MKQGEIIKLIDIYVMGRRYRIPSGLTILKALEYAGYRLTRGCGCRGGVCGACVTMYRKKGDYKLRVGLACQTVVEQEMDLMQLPFVPANRAIYSIRNMPEQDFAIAEIYPELMRCVACNTCTKACPMGLEVMDYISAAKRGDWPAVVEMSMECVMCGMCALRCPAELTQYNIALVIRRMHGGSLPPAHHLIERLEEIRQGKFDDELARLKRADSSVIGSLFQEFQAGRGDAV